MKNISFKRNESVLRGIEHEVEKKKYRPRNWDRIIYIILLLLVLFFIGRFFVNRYLFIEADGQVLFDSIDIRNIDDSRIIDLFVEESDHVEKGDSLFSYLPDDDGNAVRYGDRALIQETQSIQEKQGDVSWSEREVFQVQEDIKLNQLMIADKRKLMVAYEKELDRIRNEVMLDVLPRSSLDDRISKITQLKYDIEALEGKNNLLQSSLVSLNSMKRNLSSRTVRTGNRVTRGHEQTENSDGRRIFYSPLSGMVTRIFKSEFEVALRDEVIISIHRPYNVYIKGFFKQSDLNSLKVEDEVTLVFPDGSKGKGVIKRFYFTTTKLPEEFQKKYEPMTRSLSADIYPASQKDFEKWEMYWKLGVKIRKYKY